VSDAAHDPMRQGEAREYNRRRRRVGTAASLVSLATLVAITLAAGSLGGWGTLVALAVALPLVSLPFGLIGHRLSRSYGLSRQTAGGWFADWLKGVALSDVLGGLAALAVLGCQRLWPHAWPLPAWALAVALGLVLAAAWPLVLLPIFVRSRPLDAGPLADALTQTADQAGVAVRELRLLLMGEKTSAANAMVAGLGPTVRIYVGDTLTEGNEYSTDSEALGHTRVVLAHELGHRVHHDVWRLMAVSIASTGAGMFGAWLGVMWLAPDGVGHLTTLPSFVLGFALASALVSPASAWYSRRREWEADHYAIRLTGEGATYARAFERLTAQNLMELDPPRLRHLLTGSHPTPRQRIEAARGWQE
jgi:STE24 endopeptidase